jgi:hypothetical protein
MVSAVSSQAAALNLIASTAQTDDGSTTQAAPEATSNDGDRGPATQVSVSQARKNLLVATEQSSQAILDAYQARSDAIHRQWDIDQLNFQIDRFDWQEETNKGLADTIKTTQEHASKWANTTPVPAVQLTQAQITAILKKVAPLGIDPSKIGSADNYMFGDDGKIYTFKKDGTAWVNEGGVPISEEQKQAGIKGFAESIQQRSSRIVAPTVSRADLVAQRDALIGQQPANA